MLKVAEKTLTVTLTNTAVLYLRAYKNPPGQDEICDKHSGGTMQCDASIMQVQAYTLNEILKKSLLLLIPFFIFSHEISYCRSTSVGEICPSVLLALHYLCGEGNKITKKERPTIGVLKMH